METPPNLARQSPARLRRPECERCTRVCRFAQRRTDALESTILMSDAVAVVGATGRRMRAIPAAAATP